MSEKKRHIVAKIIFSDEAFKELHTKLSEADYKKIYDRCFKRLYDRKISKERMQTFIKDEIRSELFKLLPKHEEKIITDAEIQERDSESEIFPVKMHGVRLWEDGEPEKDGVQKIVDIFNDHVGKAMNESICPNCHSSPCMCRDY